VALTQFIVLKRKGNWAVKFNDQEQSFSAQLEAMQAAIRLANECGKNGKPSVVLLEGAKGFDTIWTYGESPFPPLQVRFAPLPKAS
jgi:hypothetical protein